MKRNLQVILAIAALMAGVFFQHMQHRQTAWSGLDPVLTDYYGESRRFSDYGERFLVVNFWAAWCEPCREEIPLLNQLHEQWGSRNVAVLGITLDNQETSREFLRQQAIAYPVLSGPQAEKLMESYGNKSGNLPFTVILDARGNVVFSRTGPLDFRQVENILTQTDTNT